MSAAYRSRLHLIATADFGERLAHARQLTPTKASTLTGDEIDEIRVIIKKMKSSNKPAPLASKNYFEALTQDSEGSSTPTASTTSNEPLSAPAVPKSPASTRKAPTGSGDEIPKSPVNHHNPYGAIGEPRPDPRSFGSPTTPFAPSHGRNMTRDNFTVSPRSPISDIGVIDQQLEGAHISDAAPSGPTGQSRRPRVEHLPPQNGAKQQPSSHKPAGFSNGEVSVGKTEMKEQDQATTKKPRILLVAPLRIARSQASRHPFYALIRSFLDRVCPSSNETVVEYDPEIPNVVYKVQFDMDDDDFDSYCKVLEVFQLAGAVHNTLASPYFDQMPRMLQPGTVLTELLAALVHSERLDLSYDLNKPWEGPGNWHAPL